MLVYLSIFHSVVYTLLDDELVYTPLHEDLTYDTCLDHYELVDHMALLGEEQDHRLHVEWVEDMLRRERDGYGADPAARRDMVTV